MDRWGPSRAQDFMDRKQLEIFIMKSHATALFLIMSVGLSPLSALGQQQADDKIVVSTNEVVLDAVVKDKKGRAVKDLVASDFEVLEDGVPQQVKSFQLVTREPILNTTSSTPGVSPGANTGAEPEPKSQPNKTGSSPVHFGALALVFDRLSPNARSIARQASLSYLADGLHPDDFVGVFGIDLSLHVLQRFTNNEALVRAAIERGLAHSSSSYASATDQISDLSDQQAALQSALDSSTVGAGQGNDPSTAMGAAAATQQFNAMTLNIVQGFERLEHDQQGYATTDGLLAIIDGMKRLPGRKALIFFSEGVQLPTNVMSHFRSVISNANRANVSIYAVDAAGLRAESADAQAGRALTKLGQARARTAGSNQDPFGSMMQDLERNEDLMRSNPDSALGDLADETGGVLIANTNVPGTRLRQVDQDLHSYYLLTYTPKNQIYDGRFRTISVKVNRSGTDVQTRKGYYALNNSYGTPVLSYEAPALALLSTTPQANSFNSRAAAFSFPESNQPGLTPVIVEVPPNAINFAIDKDQKSFFADFSVVVLIKDESQRVVRKLSNQYLLKGPLDKLANTKAGGILFYREADLAPGHYTIGAIVYDALTRQSSVNRASVTVPESDPNALRLSSIVIIEKAERSTATAEQARRPFQFGEVLVYPNLGGLVSKSKNKQLTLFVTIYTPKGDRSAPKLSLEIARENRTVGQFSYTLDAPDQTGRIQYASAIPLDKFQPGEYELNLMVQDGTRRVTRSEQVRIAP